MNARYAGVLLLLLLGGAGYVMSVETTDSNINSYIQGRGLIYYDAALEDLRLTSFSIDWECMVDRDAALEELFFECMIADDEGALGECYAECGGDLEFSNAEMCIKYLEIIPAVQAIAMGDFGEGDECYDACDADFFEEERMASCIYTAGVGVGCIDESEEIAFWDGEDIDDISEFAYTNYPNNMASFERKCAMGGGDWIRTSDVLGCFDYWSLGDVCEDETIINAGSVCTTLGQVYICNDDEVSCNAR